MALETVIVNTHGGRASKRRKQLHINGSWLELTICIIGKILLYAFTTALPNCLVIDLTLTNVIAQYDQNLKFPKKT